MTSSLAPLDEEALQATANDAVDWFEHDRWRADDDFWALVELGTVAPDSYQTHLAGQDAAALLRYAWRFRLLEDMIDEQAAPLGPPNSEDSAEDFRGWLVARGRATYAAVLDGTGGPRGLDWSRPVPGFDNERSTGAPRLPGIDLRYAAEDLWFERYGDEMPRPDAYW